jgi:hypothetical protein
MPQLRLFISVHVLSHYFFVVDALSGHLNDRSLLRVATVNYEGLVSKHLALKRSEKIAKGSSRVAVASNRQYDAPPFELETKVGSKHLRIPNQVILTGPFSNFSEVTKRRGHARLSSWLGLRNDSRILYFNDSSCSAYIREYYDDELADFFSKETRGSFRGDICRTAILLREGGFYIDLDMQLRVPLDRLVDDVTTFMTARSAVNGCLNALIAAVPNSPVLSATLAHMRKWYRNETTHEWPLGPIAMARGLQQVMNVSCPGVDWTEASTQFECGRDNIRLYSEVSLGKCTSWGPLICPKTRQRRWFAGARYGLFSVSERHLQSGFEEKFIGWSRAEDCYSAGCRVSGGY